MMMSPRCRDPPPSPWRCPHCHRSYDDLSRSARERTTTISTTSTLTSTSSALFLRGTCSHDVCVVCIADRAAAAAGRRCRRRRRRRRRSSSSRRRSIPGEDDDDAEDDDDVVEVLCPIVVPCFGRRHRQCGGKFAIDASRLDVIVDRREDIANDDTIREVIDLCCDDDDDDDDDDDEDNVIGIECARHDDATDDAHMGDRRDAKKEEEEEKEDDEDEDEEWGGDERSIHPSAMATVDRRRCDARIGVVASARRGRTKEEEKEEETAVIGWKGGSSSDRMTRSSRIATPSIIIKEEARLIAINGCGGTDDAFVPPGALPGIGGTARHHTRGIENSVVSPVMSRSYARGAGQDAPDANIDAGRTNAKVEEETAMFGVMPGGETASPMLGIESKIVSPVISRSFAGRGRRDAFDATINAGTNDIAVRSNVKVEDETMTFHLPVGERAISTGGIKNNIISHVILRSNARGSRNAPDASDDAGRTNDIAGRTNAKVKGETTTVDLPVGGRATLTRGIENNVVSSVILRSNARGGGQDAPDANVDVGWTNGIDRMTNAKVEDERRTNDIDESDGDSRFSDVDPLSHQYEDDDTEERSWGAKRGRVDPLSLVNSPYTDFWSVNRGDIQFTKQAFMTKPLFHLNSMVDGKKKCNRAFSVFLREGVATGGWKIPESIDGNMIARWTYSELRDILASSYDVHKAAVTAMWLKNVIVGSFVIMRHEYPNCEYCPRRLKEESGRYIGPVYVVGVITQKIVPSSAEERDVAENKMVEFAKGEINNVCMVSWKRMGYKKSLKESTQKYINSVCQPCQRRICNDTDTAVHQNIREDLWMKATIPISCNDFPDQFGHIRASWTSLDERRRDFS